jgi:hypothetical protein
MARQKWSENSTLEKTVSDHLDGYCVYTVLTGNYEVLNEQPALKGSRLRRICLTDNPALQSDTWEIRLVDLLLPHDPIRSQRHIKVRPAHYLPEFKGSLYIDNSVVLKVRPEEFLERHASKGKSTFFIHSFRTSLVEEFFEVMDTGLDDSTRVFEQFNHYKLEESSPLEDQVLWTGILIRDHRAPAFDAFSEAWAAQILRYTRRDQLSVNAALKQSALDHVRVAIDNYDSPWHSWPVSHGKKTHLRRNGGGLFDAEFRLETVRLSKEVEQLRRQCADLQQQVDQQIATNHQLIEDKKLMIEDFRQRLGSVTDSLSWKITEPLRWMNQKLKR